ncbi:MAG: hypothetical protein Q8P41_17075 [Pseudomonadota bacterium]|nr:hypothetical protein [Pseudomonadota bacterium]
MPRTGALTLLLLTACSGGGPSGGDGPVVIEYIDSDGDTIIDLHEGYVDPASAEDGEVTADTDADGTADYLDDDSDGDGVLDATEAGDDDPLTLPWDTDGDGEKDFRDLDADGNCIADADEPRDDLDEDGLNAFSDLDDDGDGIDDYYEIGAECQLPDSDGDGLYDYLDDDSDGDGVADRYEGGTSSFEDAPRDTDGDGLADYLDPDSDGDGFSDTEEAGGGGEPRDTDGDGTYDFADSDSDGDGISDAAEAAAGSRPYDADSDDDGFTDGAEVAAGTDPMDAGSIISGLYVTVPERTSVEETFDFSLSVQMGDVAFLLDTTCSMTSTLNGVAGEFSGIVSALSSTLPDAQYGVATFDDYNYSGYGTSGDKPFELVQQVTSSSSAVQSALSSLRVHNGMDIPESCMEALYQGLTGTGYDQNCDGRYSTSTDVFPFLSTGSDPFSGASGQFSDGSGTGTAGGFGFRDYALPIIVYATDAQMRDSDSSNASLRSVPGGCPGDAGQSDVVTAANDLGALLIGISVGGSEAVSQANTLAQRTNSVADTDGDGVADDNLVFTWSGSSSALRTTIVNAITDAVGSVQFDNVSLVVAGDEHGFVSDIDPANYAMSGSPDGETVEFTLNFRGAVAALAEDQIFRVTLNVVGDGTVLLDTLDIYVVVPGSGS